MPRLFLVRLLVSVIVIACFAGLVFSVIKPPAKLPFAAERLQGQHVLHAREGMRLPAPLIDGQIIEDRQMSLADRVAVYFQGALHVDEQVTLVVRHQRDVQRVTVHAVPGPPQTGMERFQDASGLVVLSFVLAVSLLTLWRGRDGTAAWLCVFASSLLITNAAWLAMRGTLSTLCIELLVELLQSVQMPALYGAAECAAAGGLSLRWRSTARTAVVWLAAAVAAVRLTTSILLVYAGVNSPQWLSAVIGSLFLIVMGITVLSLLVGYVRTAPASRGRLRWILVSSCVLLLSVVIQILLSPSTQPLLYSLVNIGLTGLALFGYLYGILRTRVVDITFVIDRALVFSVITAIMFGMFSLLEQTVHRLAIGEELGWIVQALGAMAVAAALSPLHRLLDRGLETVFFHKLRAMVTALRRLGRESAFFETEEALLSRVLGQVQVPCASAAIYERSGSIYQLRTAGGDGGWPGAVDADDPLFVSLRVDRRALDLKGLESAAGIEGLAFPMTVGQMLTGVIVCRLREGEQLDREVRSALSELAHALGTSLYLLRYREQAQLIADIASGRLGQEDARARAEALLVAL